MPKGPEPQSEVVDNRFIPPAGGEIYVEGYGLIGPDVMIEEDLAPVTADEIERMERVSAALRHVTAEQLQRDVELIQSLTRDT